MQELDKNLLKLIGKAVTPLSEMITPTSEEDKFDEILQGHLSKGMAADHALRHLDDVDVPQHVKDAVEVARDKHFKDAEDHHAAHPHLQACDFEDCVHDADRGSHKAMSAWHHLQANGG